VVSAENGGLPSETPAGKTIVLDAAGRRLSPCSAERAGQLVAAGQAEWVDDSPPTIRLHREVELPASPEPLPAGRGRSILLHVCCGPCGTYPVRRLREQEFDVTAFWYNPNIHPHSEHERRRRALAQLAAVEELPILEWPEYGMVGFLRAVVGREVFRERCRICYRLRLERTAQMAREKGFDAFTTTLLISPYQDEAMILSIGEDVGEKAGVPFYYERFRSGWSERGRLAKELGLYRQDYCGCVYSEWDRRQQADQERLDAGD
jgi:predicted adenine nucleotide alpha hydrolase (AANH) superfamily ATPase